MTFNGKSAAPFTDTAQPAAVIALRDLCPSEVYRTALLAQNGLA